MPNPEKDLRKDMPFRKDYRIDSYNWSLDSDMADKVVEVKRVQKINFYEFQPNVIIDVGQLIDGGVNAFLSLLPTGNTNAGGKALFEFIGGLAGLSKPAAEEALLNKFLSSPGTPFQESLDFIRYLFPGFFLYAYEFPFYDTFQLEADTTAGWSSLGSRRLTGTALADINKKGFNIDFPTTPQWSLSDQRGNSFSFSFDLINNNSENTARNWNMLNSFAAGCHWIQLGQVQKSANIFRVELEGRWQKFWCAVGIKAETQGRLFFDDNASKMIGGVVSKNFGSTTDAKSASKLGISSKVSENIRFPEAWKVTISVVDLVQNNYNVFGDYLSNGPTVSTTTISRTTQTSKTAQAAIPFL